MSDLLADLLHELDSKQGRMAVLNQYMTGTQPLAFISPESRKALGNRLSAMTVNVPSLAVSSLVERLRISGFSDPRAWDLFVGSQLDQTAPDAMADALTYGTGYVLVWSKDGRPVATVESPFECSVIRDPADRSVVAGLKRYESKRDTHCYVYLPGEVQHWVAPRTGPALSGYTRVGTVEHDLGVPLVPIDNGHSEITDLIPLVDALNKLLLDMMTASEAAGKPRRWISGLELIEQPRVDVDGNPVLDGDGQPVIDVMSPIADINTIQTMVSENTETKFGQLPASDLSGFRDGVSVIISMLASQSCLPGHYLNPLANSQVPSADGLRASEAALTARAELRQLSFSRPFETVGKLLIAVDTGRTHPDDIPLRVQWADAATRSVAQETDAVVKLVQAGILPTSYALAKLGYSDDEIARIRAAKRAETLDAQGVGVTVDDDDE